MVFNFLFNNYFSSHCSDPKKLTQKLERATGTIQAIETVVNKYLRSSVLMEIGLAISLGASGMLLSQNKPAIAATSVTANTAITNCPNFSDLPREESQLSPLALKHKVEEGDTIAKLAYNYIVLPLNKHD